MGGKCYTAGDQAKVGWGEGWAVAEFGVKQQVWGLEGGVCLDAPGHGCLRVLTPHPETLVTPRGFTGALTAWLSPMGWDPERQRVPVQVCVRVQPQEPR